MLKQVIIMRHAQSPLSFDLSDHERPLSSHGLAEAKSVGEQWIEEEQSFDQVLISSALRTQQTWAQVSQATGSDLQAVNLDGLYRGSGADYLRILMENADDSCDKILLIAHNPSVTELAMHLVADDDYLVFNPASFAIIDFEVDSWAELSVTPGKLINHQI